ncbi:hypothetical protein SAMN04488574_14012 [Bacillus sp. 71mf]|uniref:DUF2178 domain-containing protein n=2 Tax=Bacillus TaxID=1386 RepID=A0ABU8FMV3_9BACI|nr:hypothetical protein [Bacillus sp. 103mf]SFJ98610.1 hypothetical protein SAMN04488574_14012 [Bacillus sp. 71mf]SFS97060.1 hypothetical protein SAMN04488145_10622 [Bacillus sp. 103mf]
MFNYFAVGIMVVGFIAVGIMTYSNSKIGKSDERSLLLRLKINNAQYYTLLFSLTAIISWDPAPDMNRKLIFCALVLSFIVGAISSTYHQAKS